MKVNSDPRPAILLSLSLATAALANVHAGGAHANLIANFTGDEGIVLAGLKISSGRVGVADPTPLLGLFNGTVPANNTLASSNHISSTQKTSTPVSTKTSTTTTKKTTTTTTTSKTTTTKSTTTTTTTTTSATTTTTKLTLGSATGSNCAARYTNTAAGAVYGPGLGSFSFSPRPTSFVSRKVGNATLTLDGEQYRIVGPNVYWLGLDENVDPSPSYPAKGRVREAMAIAVAMGANTIRSHTLGISTGNSKSIWPSVGNTNSAAVHHGGKYDFISWAGLSTDSPDLFYTSTAVKTLFKQYIKVLLTHVNQYTGVAYKDDPTIMAWETGNELGGWMLNGGAPPAAWTLEIAAYIKSLAPNQLVSDGTDGLQDESGNLENTGLNLAGVDMVTDHFYPAENWLLSKDKAWMSYYTKNFFVGELDWTNANGGTAPSDFYALLETFPSAGSMIWSVFGHDGNCCNYVSHNDGYSLEYPNGNSATLQKQILLLVQHWYRMRGLTPPTALPAVACPQPALTA